ncbi:MAG TPA: lytic transglycosylase domain-containing protein [Acetobacteraceae bacterium]|nr:lytic transglycosylase domain-containing protein [Acetobacteraceae bacterium]
MDLLTLAAACGLAARAALFVPLGGSPLCVGSSSAAHTEGRDSVAAWQPYIAEASRRFGVSEAWIAAVMRAESGGRATVDGQPIRSPTGAMGLMQVMPRTFAALRTRYGLGANPYAPRDNILAGTAYLREMFDRYGAPWFLAAYNAGPARLDETLLTGRALPAETRRYLATLAPEVSAAAGGSLVTPTNAPPGADAGAVSLPVVGTLPDRELTLAGPNDGIAGGLFVAIAGRSDDRPTASAPQAATQMPAPPAAPPPSDSAHHSVETDRPRVAGPGAQTGDEHALFVALQ